MVDTPLPELVTLKDYKGDWHHYLEAIYQYYMNEIVNGDLRYDNLPIKCQFRPPYEGKGFAFWHAITEGEIEDKRTADLRRCERIRWINWIITNSSTCANEISSWENKRKKNNHVVLFHEKESYVVILAKRTGYYLFRTAYCATAQRKRQLIREREEYRRSLKTKGAD